MWAVLNPEKLSITLINVCFKLIYFMLLVPGFWIIDRFFIKILSSKHFHFDINIKQPENGDNSDWLWMRYRKSNVRNVGFKITFMQVNHSSTNQHLNW